MGDTQAGLELVTFLNDVDTLSTTELGFIDGVTAGTATASKAVVLGSSKEIATITTATITTVNVGDIAYAAAGDIDVAANTAAALEVDDGTTKIVVVDTRNTVKDVNGVTISSPATTIASEAAAHLNPSLKLANKTITYTGTTGTTSQLGGMLNVGVLTITDASMMTLTTASAVHINAVAAAGGSLTITNSRMISTSVGDCYLTNAGVWTDTVCWESIKDNVVRGTDAAYSAVSRVMDAIVPATWKYKDSYEATITDDEGKQRVERLPLDDRNRQRVGIVYDDLPEELRAMGEEKAVTSGILSSFSLAALKTLWEQNKDLTARLAKLEGAAV